MWPVCIRSTSFFNFLYRQKSQGGQRSGLTVVYFFFPSTCIRTCTAPVCLAVISSAPLSSLWSACGRWHLRWSQPPRPSHPVYACEEVNKATEILNVYKKKEFIITVVLLGVSCTCVIVLTLELQWLPGARSTVTHNAEEKRKPVNLTPMLTCYRFK